MNVLQGQWPGSGSFGRRSGSGAAGRTPVPDQPSKRSVLRDDLTSGRYRLIVAHEVVRSLGGEPRLRAVLSEARPTYRCPTCGNTGRLDRGCAASVVVLVPDDELAPAQLHLAHPGCSDSGVRRVAGAPPFTRRPGLSATAWLRPADTSPAAVIVLAASVAGDAPQESAAAASTLLSTLHSNGFATLDGPDASLPTIPELSARYVAGSVTVHGRHGQAMWSGLVSAPQSWNFAALQAQAIGLVIVAAVPDAGLSPSEALEQAIRRGDAVGVTLALRAAQPAVEARPQVRVPAQRRPRQTSAAVVPAGFSPPPTEVSSAPAA